MICGGAEIALLDFRIYNSLRILLRKIKTNEEIYLQR